MLPAGLARRRFLSAAVAAPFVITTPGLLMPVVDFWKPRPLLLPGGAFLPAIWSPVLLDRYYAAAALALRKKIDEDILLALMTVRPPPA